MSEERSRIWIDGFQSRLYFRVVAYWLIAVVSVWNFLFVWRLIDEGKGDPLEQFTDDRGQRFLAERRSMSPDQLILDKEAQEVVENAIARMPEIYHQVYVLADIEKLPNDDIAGILGLTILAVKSRLHRARLWMRNTLAPYFEVQAA